jgi:hypothetical protein
MVVETFRVLGPAKIADARHSGGVKYLKKTSDGRANVLPMAEAQENLFRQRP